MKTLAALIVLFECTSSPAAVTLVDKDQWKAHLGGFIELDMISDSTRSLTEVAGSTPIDRSSSYAGDNGRTQFSIRNSRFAFTILPPVQDAWKTKAYLEFDLLGYDPTPSTAAPTNSESSFFTNPTLRMRHAYLQGESDEWQILGGQYWTLFGWLPYYVPTTASVPPITGAIYERTPQVTALDTLSLSDLTKLQLGLSLVRPVQRDSSLPGVDAGVRCIFSGRKGGYASPTGDEKTEPMSLAVSGTLRQFTTPNNPGATTDMTRYSGGAVAADALIPIIASESDFGNSLTLLGEFSSGSGYGDEFPSWTGNLSQLPNPTTAILPSLDAGQGAYDGSGNFQLVKLQSWNADLQYHLPTEWRTWIGVGYSQLLSVNIGSLGNVTSGKVAYDRSEAYFGNVFHDLTAQIRVALEYDRFTTHYIDGMLTQDNRIQVSGFMRF